MATPLDLDLHRPLKPVQPPQHLSPSPVAEPAGWAAGLFDRGFETWAARAESRWAYETSPIPPRYD